MPRLIYQDSTGGSGVVEMGAQPVFIGRAVDCQIQTQDAQVSRRHARVFFDGVYWVEDNGSANGVFIGSERVQRAQLRPGDVFRCGHLQVRFEADGAPAAPPQPVYSAPPPAAPPPPAPAPPPIAPPVAAADPTAGLRAGAGAAELQAARGELETERRRRTDLEFELSESKRKLEELGSKLAAAGDPAETERLKRRVEQLESDLRRRGSASPPAGNPEALRAAEAERDRLRTRVSELEAQLAAQPSGKDKGDDGDAETTRLKRRVEQLESDLRRLRSNKPTAPEPKPEPKPEPGAPAASAAAQAADDKLHELEEQLRKLTQERDEAMRKALTSAGQDIRITEELDKSRRRIEQLESELKRRPVAAMSDVQRMDQQQQQLESALRQLRDTERERDALKEVIARGAAPARPPQKALDGLTTVSDGLADIRTALRAAGDDAALEQLEQLRTTLRQALGALGVST